MRRIRSPAIIGLLAAALVGLAGLLALGAPSRAQSDQSILANFISRLLSTPGTQVQVGSIEGALSSNAVIRDLQISDRDGVWLKVDRARLIWKRTALLRGQLQVDALEIGRVEFARRPVSSGAAERAVSDEPVLPQLPVKAVVQRFTLAELVLGAPVLGTAARLAADGSASLGTPSEGLDLTFRATRLDAPGRATVGLGYVPQSNALRLDLVHDEPAGGLAARLLELPGLPPVALRISGEGPLTGFAARLNLAAGPTIGAEGEVRVARAGAAYRATLGLSAQVSGLVPEAAAPIFEGTTRLDGDVVVHDDGRIGVPGVHVAAPVAMVELSGTVSADRTLDLTITGRAVTSPGQRAPAGRTEIGALNIDLSVKGSPTLPQVSGTIAGAGLKLPQAALNKFNVRLDTSPSAGTTTSDRLRVIAHATAEGLSLTDQALGRALGEWIVVRARGTVDLAGDAVVEEAQFETPTGSASFTGRLGPQSLDGIAQVRLPLLSPFSGLAGRSLAGSAQIETRLKSDPSGSVNARLDGRLSDFTSGDAVLDGALGPSVTLSGVVRRLPDGFAAETLRLAGANLEAVLDGRATRETADLALRATVPELKRLDPRISSGRAQIQARLTGSLERPDAVATVTVEDVRALDRSISRLVVDLKGRDVTGALDATLRVDGDVAGKRALGALHLVRPADGSLLLDHLDLSVGSVSLKGGLRVSARGLAQGDVLLAAGNLDDVSPLALTRLGGSINANVVLSAENDAQAANITAEGSHLQLGAARLADLKAALAGRDLLHRPTIDGKVEAGALTVGGQTFRQVRLTADGAPDRTRFALTAAAQGFALETTGRLVPAADSNSIELTAFEARRGSKRIMLASPTTIIVAPDATRISDLALLVDGGRLLVSGQVGGTLDLSLQAARVPLSAADIVVPGLGLSGSLDGRLMLQGTTALPTGSYEITLSQLASQPLRDAGLRAVNVRAAGQLADARASVQATIDATQAGQLRIVGSVPLGTDGILDLTVGGRLDLRAMNGALSASGQRIAGTSDVDLRVRGTALAPVAEGSMTLSGGTFEDPIQGVRLTAIEGRLVAKGTMVQLERLTAQTPPGGSLAATGRITLDPAAGLPADIHITGTRAQLATNATTTAVADLNLSLRGPLLRQPQLGGRIDLVSLDVTVPDRLPVTLRPLPATKHVQPPAAAAARLAVARQRQASSRRAKFIGADLDLTITAQNRIFVRGRGIEAELGGDLRLTGTSGAPIAVGGFEMRRGQLDILGQRLSFSRGRLDFRGDLMPSLDFMAETRAGSVTARIGVTGPAASPEFLITSNPDLPQDEVLSRILFQRAAGGLTPGQAIQLAQAVATLSGGSGSGAFEQVRRSLGVDSLDISTNSSGDPTVGASRYISDRVRLGVRAGARPDESAVSLDVDITRRLKAQGQVGADGRSSVGVGVEWEY